MKEKNSFKPINIKNKHMKKVIKWKIFYYMPFNNYIYYYSPTLYRLGILFLDFKRIIRVWKAKYDYHWDVFKEKSLLCIVKADMFIEYADHHISALKREIINLILYYVSLPFVYIGYKISNDINYDFSSLIQYYEKYKYHLLFLIYIIGFVYLEYKEAELLDSFANYAMLASTREKYIYTESVAHINHSMVQNFGRLNFMKAILFGYYAAEICIHILTWLERFITDSVIMPWPIMFFAMWTYTDQIMEPEVEMRRNKFYQRIRMIIGFLFESS